jgi:hypothetical protein
MVDFLSRRIIGVMYRKRQGLIDKAHCALLLCDIGSTAIQQARHKHSSMHDRPFASMNTRIAGDGCLSIARFECAGPATDSSRRSERQVSNL